MRFIHGSRPPFQRRRADRTPSGPRWSKRGPLGALVMVALLLPLLPNAAPTHFGTLTWTRQADDFTCGIASCANAGRPVFAEWGAADHYVRLTLSSGESASNSYELARCSRITADGCTTFALVGGTAGTSAALDYAGNGVFVASAYDLTNLDLLFFKSTDDGISWGTNGAPNGAINGTNAASAGNANHIAAYSTTGYVITFQNATSGAFNYGHSTDAGATWTFGTVQAAITATESRIAVKDATTWITVFNTASSVRACRTSNAGATWACQNLSSSGSTGPLAISYSHADTWRVIWTGRVGKSQDGGVLWTSATSPASMMAWPDIAIEDETTFYIPATSISGNNNNPWTPVRFYETNNGGTSFTLYAAPQVTCVGGSNSCLSGSGAAVAVAAGRGMVFAHEWRSAGQGAVSSYVAALDSNIAAAYTVPFTDLVGYDVDPLGATMIARTDGGDFVRVRGAQILGGGGDQETNCNALHGVFSSYVGDLVGFRHCDDGGELWVRTRGMAVPTASDMNGCEPSTCPTEMSLSDFDAAANTGLAQMYHSRAFPLNRSNSQAFQSFTIADWRAAWAFSGSSGGQARIGFALHTAHPDPIGDHTFTRTVPYPGGATLANDFCVGLDGTEFYIAAVANTDSSRSWPLAFTPAQKTANGNADVTFGTPTVYASAYAIASGIGCGGPNIILQNANGAFALDRKTGTPIQSWTTAAASDMGVAISDRFTHPVYGGTVQFVAFKDGATVKVAYVGNGTVVAEFAVPGGTWYGVKMDRTAQSVWIGTSTSVSRYDVAQFTTVQPVSPQQGSLPPAAIVAPVSPVGDLIIGQAEGALGPFEGLFLSAVTIVFFACGVWAESGGNQTMGIVGGFAGFITALSFGFIGLGHVFAIIAAVLLFIYAKGKFTGGQGG